MSLEEAIRANTAAVENLTRILLNPVISDDSPICKVTAADIAENRAEGESLNDTKKRLEKDGAPEVPNAESLTPASGEPSQPAPEQSSPEVTYDDVKKATNNLSAAKGKEVTIGVLSRFGVKRATELTREQWLPYIVYADNVTRGAIDA